MRQVTTWDLFVRIFHWSLVILFFSAFFVFDDESAAHRYAGYAVLSLVAARFVWGFVGTRPARFSSFPPDLSTSLQHLNAIRSGKMKKVTLSHNPLGALMVYNLLASLTIVCVSGIMMTLDQFWGVEWVEEVHELAANYTLFCVALHVLGVIIESRRSNTNLVLAMITGKKDVPNDRVASDVGRIGQNDTIKRSERPNAAPRH